MADPYTESAFAKANSAYIHAEAAFDTANSKFSSSGGTVSGNITVTGSISTSNITVNKPPGAPTPDSWNSIIEGISVPTLVSELAWSSNTEGVTSDSFFPKPAEVPIPDPKSIPGNIGPAPRMPRKPENYVDFKACSFEEEGKWISFAEKSDKGLELHPPKLPKFIINNRSVKGAPTLSPLTRGVVCGTGVGNSNINITINCNFTEAIKLDSCVFKLEKTMEMMVNKAFKFAWYIALRFFPFLNFIKSMIEAICNLLNNILQIVCFLKQIVQCILNTVRAITLLIQWILSLPFRIVEALFQCANKLFYYASDILTRAKAALSITGALSLCSSFNCEESQGS